MSMDAGRLEILEIFDWRATCQDKTAWRGV